MYTLKRKKKKALLQIFQIRPSAEPGREAGLPGSALPSVGSVRFKNDIFEPPAARPAPVAPLGPLDSHFFLGSQGVPKGESLLQKGCPKYPKIMVFRDFATKKQTNTRPKRYQGGAEPIGPRQKLPDGVFETRSARGFKKRHRRASGEDLWARDPPRTVLVVVFWSQNREKR